MNPHAGGQWPGRPFPPVEWRLVSGSRVTGRRLPATPEAIECRLGGRHEIIEWRISASGESSQWRLRQRHGEPR